MYKNIKTNNKRKPIKKIKKQFNKSYKTIIRENNLTTLYVLSFLLAVLFVFPIVINYLLLMTSLVVVSGIGLAGYVVVHRTIDYRNRPLQQRLLEALPDKGIKYAATAKFLSGGYDRQWQVIEQPKQIEETTEIVDIQPIKTYSFDEAYKQSDKYQWNIGQIEGSNDLATFNFTKQSHVLVCGGTNCGKTSTTGFMLALYALKSKFHVIVFDGANGADWKPFEQYVEFYGDAQPEHLETIISNIERLYQERQDKLKQLGTANNYDLDKPLQPIVILIDELGYLLDGLRSIDKNQYKSVVQRFQKMIRVIRKTSIHLVLIDQNANSIPQEILTNIKCIFAYNAEGHIGNAIKRYNLDKLKAQGQFNYQNKIVDGWYTKKFLPQYLPSIKPVKQQLMLTDERLKDEEIVPCTVDAKDIDSDNGGIAATSCTTVCTVQKSTTVQLPKFVSTKSELINRLIEAIKAGELVNDNRVRKLHQEIYGKAINGTASKQIVEYVQSKVSQS